jgi:BirA family biotin operon repressor/biotin-[acetyl-CoA-carboxylase] ligase
VSSLLNKDRIAQYLQEAPLCTEFKLHLFDSLDSTNRYLKDLPPSPIVDICCAETQTQGRGRFGRHWHSPFGENIYCSSRWNEGLIHTSSGLSLVVSLAVLATLNDLYHLTHLKIKWPNDILWHNKKLCGILIESNNKGQIIIGIGLNVNTNTKNHLLPDKPWCSLYEIRAQYSDRNILIAKLMTTLESYLTQLKQHDFNFFMDEWSQFDYLMGKNIKVTQSLTTFSGIAKGVNQDGQLIVINEAGINQVFSSGDTSLKEL